MQRFLPRLPRFYSYPNSRFASGGPVQFGPRWVEKVRSESNIITYDDPPSAPLSEDHEVGEGASDFSNYIDKNEDVSTVQAVVGLSSALAFCYAIYRYSASRASRSAPLYTMKEFPYVEQDMPTWENAATVNENRE